MGGLGMAVIGSIFNNAFFIYLGTIILIVGSLMIPKLEEQTKRPEPNKTYEADEVLDAEVREVLSNKKHLKNK